MSVSVLTRDVSPGVEVRDVYRKELGYVWQLEDGVEECFKREMGVKNGL